MKKSKLLFPILALTSIAPAIAVASCTCVTGVEIKTTMNGNVFTTSQYSINQNATYKYKNVKTIKEGEGTITFETSAKNYGINVESITMTIKGKKLDEITTNGSVTKKFKIPSGYSLGTEIYIEVKYASSVISGAITTFTIN